MTPHNHAKPGDYAEAVLLPGDPLRAKWVAETFLKDAKLVNSVRNCLGYTGTWNGKRVSVQATGMDDREMIEIGANCGDWEKDRKRVSRTALIGIMRPRVEEILEEVRAILDAAGFEQLPSQQIVLTGGASQIPGLDGLAARILGQNVRLGRPLRVQGLPQAATGAGFASTVGLCLFAAHPQDEWWDFPIPAERYPARSLRRAAKWFKDNW